MSEPPFENESYQQLRQGKTIVSCVIGFMLGLTLLSIFIFHVVLGSSRIEIQLARLGIEVGLSICLYHGQSWARYLLVTLFGLGVLLTLYLMYVYSDKLLNPIVLIGFIAVLVSYGSCAFALTSFPSVGKFMKYQREPRSSQSR